MLYSVFNYSKIHIQKNKSYKQRNSIEIIYKTQKNAIRNLTISQEIRDIDQNYINIKLTTHAAATIKLFTPSQNSNHIQFSCPFLYYYSYLNLYIYYSVRSFRKNHKILLSFLVWSTKFVVGRVCAGGVHV